jgi:hypothetical protein
MNSVATLFATQPVYNAARAAHALRSDQQELLFIHITDLYYIIQCHLVLYSTHSIYLFD